MTRILLLVLLQAITVISFAQAPPNDECVNATLVTVSPAGTCTNAVAATSWDATESMPPCTFVIANDVWFRFVALDATQVITIQSGGSGIYNPITEVFSGSCGGLTSIFCEGSVLPPSYTIRKIVNGLTPGATYYVRIYAENFYGNTFTFCVARPSVNDECAGAINIPLNTGLDWTTVVTSNNNFNSNSGTDCHLDNQRDGWFSFVAQDTVHVINVSGPSSADFSNFSNMTVNGGHCGALTPVEHIMYYGGVGTGCFFTPSYDGYYGLRGLTPGNTYYVNIMQDMSKTANNANNFNVAVSNVPANDGITGAETITVNTGTDCTSKTTGNLRNATATKDITHNCGQFYNNTGTDVWYKFTATANRHLVSATFLSVVQNPGFQVYYLNAGNLTPITCGSGNNQHYYSDLSALTPGTEYYIRVKTNRAYFTNEYFDLCISTPGATPANNDCAAAQTLPLSGQILGSSVGSNITAGLTTSCSGTGSAMRDVWYTFTAPSDASATLQVVTPDVNPFTGDVGIELYTGACGAQTRIDCADFGALQVTELNFAATSGTTYYARLFFTQNSSNNTPFQLSFSQFAGLPVTITGFKAEHTSAGSIKLTWNTADESGVNYYDIERSGNGILFSQVARIPARNTPGASEYTGEDLSPLAGVSYYRLKAVDLDGTAKYSKTLKMSAPDRITGNIKASRHGNNILIHNYSAEFKNVTVNIFTATGQKIYSAAKTLTAGVNSISVVGKLNQPLFIQLVTEEKVMRTLKVF